MSVVTTIRVAFITALAFYSWRFFTATMLQLGDNPGFIHYIHLVFHEAGHVLLTWTTPILHSFGGTLGQVAVPLILSVAFAIRNRDGFASSVCAWWAGHALLDAAPYINDARATRLILLGGATGDEIEGHDWNFIFTELNMLSYDVRIARIVLLSGRIVMVLALMAAVAWTIYEATRHPAQPDETTDA